MGYLAIAFIGLVGVVFAIGACLIDLTLVGLACLVIALGLGGFFLI